MNEQSNVVRMALPPVTKEFVEGLRKEAETAYTKYLLLKDSTEKAEREYLKKSQRFRDLDYQLALVDGRLKKVQPKVETKKKKIPKLSLEQLREIAITLGVKIPVETLDEELEDDEEQEPVFETDPESAESIPPKVISPEAVSSKAILTVESNKEESEDADLR
jgi:NADH dehydrogenase/NADH:ubiquinone oxidoreductase subunit G